MNYFSKLHSPQTSHSKLLSLWSHFLMKIITPVPDSLSVLTLLPHSFPTFFYSNLFLLPSCYKVFPFHLDLIPFCLLRNFCSTISFFSCVYISFFSLDCEHSQISLIRKTISLSPPASISNYYTLLLDLRTKPGFLKGTSPSAVSATVALEPDSCR